MAEPIGGCPQSRPFITRVWNLTTHATDPDVDEARDYPVEDLLTTEAIRTFGTVAGVGAATKENPHRNLMFAPWWTDGRRVVLHSGGSEDRIPITQGDYFSWYQPGQDTRKMEGRKLEGGSLADLQSSVDKDREKADGAETDE